MIVRYRRPLSILIIATALTATTAGCALQVSPTPQPTATFTYTPTPTPTPTPTYTPLPPSPTAKPDPVVITPAPVGPPTPPNAMGGQTDGGNTPNTPVVDDSGEQPFAVGSVTKVSDDEYHYVVAKDDQILAIASRFQLQVADVERVNFPCSDPLEMQPGDVLDIRWPLPTEQIGPQYLWPSGKC